MNEPAKNQPWGLVAGLLTASFATLVGIGSGLEPETILLRAAIAATAVGIAVRFAIGLARLLRESS